MTHNKLLSYTRAHHMGRVLGCLALALAVFCAGIINNAYLYAAVVPLFPEARECAASFEALVYLVIFFIALKRPLLIRSTPLGFATIILCALLVPLLCFSFYASSAPLITLGFCLRSLCKALLQLFLVAALLSLRDMRQVAVVVTAGMFGSRLLEPILRLLPQVYAAVCVIGAMYLCAAIVGTRLGHDVFPAVLSSASQRSRSAVREALRSSQIAKFVVCTLLFYLATGYARCLKGVEGAAAPISVEASLVVLAILAVLFARKDNFVDSVFSLSVLLVLAGFLLVPLTMHTTLTVANVSLTLGGCCFAVLLWMVLVGIGERNLLLLIPVFSLCHCAEQVGVVLGSVTANVSMAVYQDHASLSSSLALICAFVFMAFLWIGFRDFSFSEVIFGIQPEPIQDERERIALRCAALGESARLTSREQEILELLARGRNTTFIMDSLVLSKNTVKSHVKHIYSKLGVHSRQELIDLFDTP